MTKNINDRILRLFVHISNIALGYIYIFISIFKYTNQIHFYFEYEVFSEIANMFETKKYVTQAPCNLP